MTTTTATLSAHVVQFAAELSDSAWTTHAHAIALSDVRGLGQLMGSAQVRIWWGDESTPAGGANPVTVARDVPAVGKLVRICAKPDTGALVPLWHGAVDGIVEDADGRAATIACVGIRAWLTRCYFTRGWELARDGSVIDPGFCPPFNGMVDGDRSEDTVTVGDVTTYVHDRGTQSDTVTARNAWLASNISDTILKLATLGLGTTASSTLKWRLGNVATDYIPPLLDPNGRNVADVLNELWNQRHGCSWIDRVVNDTVFIDVIRLAGTATDIDLTGNRLISDPTVETAVEAYDIIVVTAAQPFVGVTLRWKAGEESTCALNPVDWTPGTAADDIVDAALEIDQPYTGKAWRLFRLNPAWNGISHGATNDGLRANLADDGTRTWQQQVPSPCTLQIDRSTPWGEGGTDDATGTRHPVVVIAGKTDAWEDLKSSGCSIIPTGGIPPGGTAATPAVIAIGDTADAADALRSAVGTDGELRITVGIREWAPIRLTWKRDASQWPIPGYPRVYHRRVSGVELHRGCNGATLALNDDGTLKTATAEQIIRDDTAKLTALMGRLKDWYGTPHGKAVWGHDSGTLVPAFPVGTYVGNLITSATQTYSVNAPITQIARDYRTGVLTYQCLPVQPDLDSLA